MKVSVIIPVHNRKKELERAINSVLKQIVNNFEVYVVDDCSDENIEELVAGFNDIKLKYLKLPEKGNGNIARNTGIKAATGEYIALLDSDDEWLPNHLENKIGFIEQWGCDGVFGSAKIYNGKEYLSKVSRPFKKGESMIDYLLSDGFAQTSSYFFKANAIKNILFDETLLRHQDYDLSVRFADKFEFLPNHEITVIVHWHESDKRETDFKSQIQFIEKNTDKISPRIYNWYHTVNYHKALAASAPKEITEYYKKNGCKYVKHLSLADYFSLHRPKTTLEKILLRIKFLFKLCLVNGRK